MSGFQWNDAKRGQRIEDFIHEMTCDRPALMREVLAIGLGDLRYWTDAGVVVGASCGCLIGTCAIAATRVHEDFDPTTVVGISTDEDYVSVVPMTLAAAIAGRSRRKADYFDKIGTEVSDECGPSNDSYEASDEREAAVRSYIADVIKADLRLLKVPVPRPRPIVVEEAAIEY